MLLGSLMGLRFFGAQIFATLMHCLEENLTMEDPSVATHVDVINVVLSQGKLVLSAAGPIMLLLVAIAIVSNLLQVGILFSTEPLRPQLNKISPISGVGRLFSVRTTMQLVMNLLKLLIVCVVAYVAIKHRADKIMLAMMMDGWQRMGLCSVVLYEVGLDIAIALLIIALLDYMWQRYKFERDLRMTKQEVKEEMRRMEGDPILKQRRRKMQMVAAMQKIRKTVPTADVIVTNPTELAIAIKYDSKAMHAPKVVAKGADYLAKKIREIATMHGIPIIERKPLAQALYKMVEVGQEVPEQFYKAVAEILAYVYRLSGRKMASPVHAA